MSLSYDINGWQVFLIAPAPRGLEFPEGEAHLSGAARRLGADVMHVRTAEETVHLAIGFAPAGWRLPSGGTSPSWVWHEAERACRAAVSVAVAEAAAGVIPPAAYQAVRWAVHNDGETWMPPLPSLVLDLLGPLFGFDA